MRPLTVLSPWDAGGCPHSVPREKRRKASAVKMLLLFISVVGILRFILPYVIPCSAFRRAAGGWNATYFTKIEKNSDNMKYREIKCRLYLFFAGI
jgi:hypothetical protein